MGRSTTRIAPVFPAHPAINDSTGWFKLGRGHAFLFYAETKEVVAWLGDGIGSLPGPFWIVGGRMCQVGRSKFEHHPFRFSLEEWSEAVVEGKIDADGPVLYHLWSETMTPGLLLRPGVGVPGLCMVNGLVTVRHRHGPNPFDGLREPTDLVITNRVRSDVTGEERSYDGYYALYKSLKSQMKRLLTHQLSSPVPGGGSETVLMTEQSFQAYRAGGPFQRFQE